MFGIICQDRNQRAYIAKCLELNGHKAYATLTKVGERLYPMVHTSASRSEARYVIPAFWLRGTVFQN